MSREAGTGAGTGTGLLDGVRQWLAESGSEPTPARVAQALREQGRVLGGRPRPRAPPPVGGGPGGRGGPGPPPPPPPRARGGEHT
ncbi:hypothetical protein ACFWIZ_36515, partial [Streptomyces sp. NPDC127044]